MTTKKILDIYEQKKILTLMRLFLASSTRLRKSSPRFIVPFVSSSSGATLNPISEAVISNLFNFSSPSPNSFSVAVKLSIYNYEMSCLQKGLNKKNKALRHDTKFTTITEEKKWINPFVNTKILTTVTSLGFDLNCWNLSFSSVNVWFCFSRFTFTAEVSSTASLKRLSLVISDAVTFFIDCFAASTDFGYKVVRITSKFSKRLKAKKTTTRTSVL